MKNVKIFYFVIIIATGFAACESSANKSKSADSTNSQPLPPPSENSNATNPSLADTAYPSKDTMVTHGDSIRAKK